MNFVIFDPGFIVYPILYMCITTFNYFVNRKSAPKFIICQIIITVFWAVIIYGLLSLAKNWQLLPCLDFLGNKLFGCI